MTDQRHTTNVAQDDTTHPDPNVTVIPPVRPAKKPHVRSSEQSAADYLLDQNRIGQFNQYPYRKHRYITVYMPRLLDALTVLYVHFFKVNWEKFARVADKLTTSSTGDAQFLKLAHVYLSHWANDLYYMVRKSCMDVDPLAFAEKYHVENARYANKYDNFLTLLMNAIKPTPIHGAIADEMYIPVLDNNPMDFSKNKKLFSWDKYSIDQTIFQFVHQTMEIKKIVKMTPISDDPIGRPSWLFDWFEQEAYAWFPMEQNYNEIDIAIAYTIGAACTPKVSLPDADEWRYFEGKINVKNIDVQTLPRATARKRYGTSEHRILEIEEVPLPNFYESDADKFKKMNIGPLRIFKKGTAEETESSSTQTEDDQVPSSPRPLTRLAATDAPTGAIRVRILDYIYHSQVVLKFETATRFTAFKLFMAPPPSS